MDSIAEKAAAIEKDIIELKEPELPDLTTNQSVVKTDFCICSAYSCWGYE